MSTDLKLRVATVAAVVTAVLLSLVSAAGYVALINATRQSQVDQLEDRLDELEGRLAAGDDEVISQLRLDVSLRVIREGQPRPEAPVGTLQVVRAFEGPGGRPVGEPPVVALVGRVSTVQLDQTFATLRTALWVSVLTIAVLVGAASWLVVDRALAPVRKLTARATAVEADPSAELLPVGPSSDEIASLAATFNDLLAKLRRADAERRRFVSDASHELRTPLTVLAADAEYALDHGRGAEDTRELARSVLVQSERLRVLVDDLLTLAALDEGSGVEADRARTTVADVLVGSGADGLSTGMIGPEVAAAVVPDISRSVGNVVANALRYREAEVVVGAVADRGEVTFTVDDDGPGIPVGQRSAIFERFYRPDGSRTRNGGGAGLGLAIARTELAAVGGTITVDDGPLGGARFSLTVPRLDRAG